MNIDKRRFSTKMTKEHEAFEQEVAGETEADFSVLSVLSCSKSVLSDT
jgi:hypothetical protein